MRTTLCLLAAVLLLAFPAYAAKALPADQAADPVCGLLSPWQTDLRVEEQWLTYRLQENAEGEQSPRTAEVVSTWRLRNPNFVLPIQQPFALPIVTSLVTYDKDITGLTMNDRRLPHTVTLLSPYETDQDHPLESGLLPLLLSQGLSEQDGSFLPKRGELYTLLDAAQEQPYTVVVSFRLPERAVALHTGFEQASESAGLVTLTHQAKGGDEADPPDFLVLGGVPADLTFTAYRTVDGRQETVDQSVVSLARKEQRTEEHLTERIQRQMSLAAQAGATGMTGEVEAVARQMALRELQRRTEDGQQLLPLQDVLHSCFFDRSLAVLQWELTLKAGEERLVNAAFRSHSGVENQQYSQPSYPFTFYLNPANSWPYYGPVHLAVEPAADTPYLVADNVGLEQRGAGAICTASFQTPAEGYLTFQLSSQSPMVRFLRTSPLVVLAALALLFLLALAVLLRLLRVTRARW